jgi:hypothetical protein
VGEIYKMTNLFGYENLKVLVIFYLLQLLLSCFGGLLDWFVSWYTMLSQSSARSSTAMGS